MENEIHKSETPSQRIRRMKRNLREAAIKRFVSRLRPEIGSLYAGKPGPGDRLLLRFLYRHAKEPGVTADIRLPAEPLLTAFTDKTHPAFTEDGLILNQRRLRGVPFGDKGNTADHGCGWVSYYNVKRLLGASAEPLDALRAVWRGQRKGGLKGTDPFYLIRLLRSEGFYAELFFGKDDMARAVRYADAVIVLYLYAKRDRLFGHFVAAKTDPESGLIRTLNGEHGDDSLVESVEAICSPNSFMHMLIAVSKKRG